MFAAARRVAGGAAATLLAAAAVPRVHARCEEKRSEALVRVPSTLPLKTAGQIAEGALAEAAKHALHPLAVVVLDSGGHDVLARVGVRAFAAKRRARPQALREDGCGVLRVDVARGKAYACLSMGMSSRRIRDRLAGRPTFVGALSDVSGGRFVPVPGGVLIVDEGSGDAIGAVGVSGDTSDKDEMVAVVAVNAQAGLRADPAAPSEAWRASSLGPHA